MANQPLPPNIDWKPQPGYMLVTKLTREQVAELYNRGHNNLSLPDNVGKVSDSLGVGCVEMTSAMLPATEIEWVDMLRKIDEKERPHYYTAIKPGDYVAFMPYTDALMEIDGKKYSVLPYDKVWAVRKGATK